MSDQGNGQWPQQPDPQHGDGQQPPQQGPGNNQGQPLPGQSGGQRLPGQPGPGQPGPGQSGGQRLPGQSGSQPLPGQSGGQPQQGNTGGQWAGPQQQGPGGNTGGQQQPGNDGGQWTGGQQQPWSGSQQPWASGGHDAQPPSWSTGQTGPNVGETMNNPQNAYYDRFSAASGEGISGPQHGGGNGGGRGKVLIGLAAALVLIVAAVAIFAFTRGDNSPTEAGGSSSTSALPPVKATTWVNPTLAEGARALKSGWQAQQANDDRGIFDVPKTKDWKLESKDTFYGYADPSSDHKVITKAPAIYGEGFCSSKDTAETAWLGLVNVGKRDPSDAGPDVLQKFADVLATKKDGSKVKQGKLSDPKSIKVNQGTIPALQYTMTTGVGEPDDCDKGKQYKLRTVTFSSGGKSYQLISVRMLDAPKSQLSEKKLDEIVSTFRPSN